jgi:hypothetical protein
MQIQFFVKHALYPFIKGNFESHKNEFYYIDRTRAEEMTVKQRAVYYYESLDYGIEK